MRWFSPSVARPTEDRRDLDTLGDHELTDECEAFLGGEYVEARHAAGFTAPVWSWLNEAAHADAEHLAAVGAVPADHPDIELRTRALLARAVVSATRSRPLAELQREVLVPLELAVMGTDPTPRRLVELVGRALYLS